MIIHSVTALGQVVVRPTNFNKPEGSSRRRDAEATWMILAVGFSVPLCQKNLAL
jgi:hypothetical protein